MKTLASKIVDYLMLTIGVLVYCSAWGFFMVPNGMSSGGLTGLCTVVQYATGGAVPLSYSYAAVNVVLLLLAFFIMGGKLGLKTIYCIALVTLVFEITPLMTVLHSVEGRFMYVPERFMIPLIAGILEGIGLGIIFRNGGSTGGSDILALVVNKYWPVSPGKFFLATDFFIVLSLLLLPGRTFSDLIYGFIMIIASSLVLDSVLVGGRGSVQLIVFSDHYKEIADYIVSERGRGATVIECMGWFTKQDRNALLLMMNQKEVGQVTRRIHEIDRNALISVSTANNIYGEGFEEMKTGISKKSSTSNETD